MPSDERFDRVVREHGPALKRLVSAWERNHAAQEDLLQEVLVALWRALPHFRGEASERTFVFRVAMNRALNHRYRRPEPAEPLEAASHVPDGSTTPEAAAAAGQQRATLVAAVQQLPPSMREVITLSLEGLSGKDIAEILGIRENSVHARLSRARKALQEALQQT